MLRIDQTPAIEVYLIPSGEAPGGIGETGTPPASGSAQPILRRPEIALRRLPIDRDVLAGKKTATS